MKLKALVLPVVSAVLLFVACGKQSLISDLNGGGQGTIIDNGGDKITCGQGPAFTGDYALDYVMSYDAASQQDPHENNWQDLAARTKRILNEKAPAAMAQSFSAYLDEFMSGRQSGNRVWHATALTLSDLRDEGQLALIPDHCMVTRAGKQVPNLTQMVRRRYLDQDGVTKVHYYYDHSEMESFRRDLPLQYSYIAVHEWLWDYADSPWANRSINHLIHSRQAEQMTAAQFQSALRSFGVDGSEGNFVGRPSGTQSRLRDLFGNRDICDFSRRVTAEFSDNGRVVLNGREVTMEIRIEDTENRLGGKICGFALVTEADGASINLTLSAGPFSYAQGVSGKEFIAHGVCRDQACREGEGPLGQVVFPAHFSANVWKLTARSNGAAALISPRLIAIGMRQ